MSADCYHCCWFLSGVRFSFLSRCRRCSDVYFVVDFTLKSAAQVFLKKQGRIQHWHFALSSKSPGFLILLNGAAITAHSNAHLCQCDHLNKNWSVNHIFMFQIVKNVHGFLFKEKVIIFWSLFLCVSQVFGQWKQSVYSHILTLMHFYSQSFYWMIVISSYVCLTMSAVSGNITLPSSRLFSSHVCF